MPQTDIAYVIRPGTVHMAREIRASFSRTLLAKVDHQGLHLYDRRGGVNYLLAWTDIEQMRLDCGSDTRSA